MIVQKKGKFNKSAIEKFVIIWNGYFFIGKFVFKLAGDKICEHYSPRLLASQYLCMQIKRSKSPRD